MGKLRHASVSSDGQMGWTVSRSLQGTKRRIRGTKKRKEAVDVGALIMRLQYKTANYSIA